MEKHNIKRVFIWPVSLRFAHSMLIISLTGLTISGWILKNVDEAYISAFDFHFIFALVLVITLSIRLHGFVVKPTGVTSLKSLLPKRQNYVAILTTLRCYFSFGRLPLPNWHAHNPLWAPLYLIMYIILVLQAVNGFLLYAGYHTLVIDLHQYHDVLTTCIVSLVSLHILTAIIHDLVSGNSDISAMIHGYRIFRLTKPNLPTTTHFVSFKNSHNNQDDI